VRASTEVVHEGGVDWLNTLRRGERRWVKQFQFAGFFWLLAWWAASWHNRMVRQPVQHPHLRLPPLLPPPLPWAAFVDPSDVDDLFIGLVDMSNSTNSTLLVERSSRNCKGSFGMSCWAADVAWDLLNLTLSGRLIRYIPAAAPCHNTLQRT